VTSDADAHERLLALTHDLRTPLTLVTGFAEMLRRDGLTDEQRADYLRRLAECAREMTEILDAQDLGPRTTDNS
jgi:signal transduction histidine kinase